MATIPPMSVPNCAHHVFLICPSANSSSVQRLEQVRGHGGEVCTHAQALYTDTGLPLPHTHCFCYFPRHLVFSDLAWLWATREAVTGVYELWELMYISGRTRPCIFAEIQKFLMAYDIALWPLAISPVRACCHTHSRH